MTDSVRQDAGPRDLEYQYEHQAVDGPVRRYHHRDMTHAEVARAIRPGSRRARDQGEAKYAALECPDLACVRGDFRANLEAWIRVHIDHASWGGDGRPPAGVTSPGRRRVCELIRNPRTGRPMSSATYKRCRAWWAERGYIFVVRPGWTPDLKAAALVGPDDVNQSQAYVVCVPRRAHPKKARPRPHGPSHPLNEPLTVFSKKTVLPRHGGSEKNRSKERPGASCCYPAGRPPAGLAKGAPRHDVLRHGTLAALSDRWWAFLTQPFASWSAVDVVWAVDHDRDGRQHPGRADSVRHPVGWLRWRLSHWLQPDGTACPSPSAARAARTAAAQAEQAARRAEDARTAAAALRSLPQDRVTAAAAAARELLAARSASAAAALARMEATRPARQAPQSAPRPPAAPAVDLSAWRARRTAQDGPQRPQEGAGDPPRTRSPQPLPDWWQAAVDAAVAAVEAEEAAGLPSREPTAPSPSAHDRK